MNSIYYLLLNKIIFKLINFDYKYLNNKECISSRMSKMI